MTNRVRLRYLLKKEVYKILNEGFLAENYSEGTIQKILTKWGITPGDKEEGVAREMIKSFAEKKDSLKSKLDILVLPDSLKVNN